MKVSVIGGGAAGFFTAINLARLHPDWEVEILEKSNKLLSKVKISGGGRCNVTHHCFQPRELSAHYPRGQKKLASVFKQFGPEETIRWFEERGIKLKVEPDGRMFPTSDQSQTIIDTFLSEAKKYGVAIHTSRGLSSISPLPDQRWELQIGSAEKKIADKVVIATGSQPSAWKIMNQLGLKMVPQVPSLFTFNCKDSRLKDLQGLSFASTQIKVAGTKLIADGPLLITHWGLSGPAILRLSAWGARILAEKDYEFEILINLTGKSQEEVRHLLTRLKSESQKKKPENVVVEGIPKRYWHRLCELVDFKPNQTFGEISKKQLNKLAEEITQGSFPIKGKSTFKEEFVTAGGVDLSEVDFKTMQARRFPNLYFAGEILDVDAITGGFNFQACWSEGWLIANHMQKANQI